MKNAIKFVKWHALQAFLSQLFVMFPSSLAFWWTLSIFFGNSELSSSYLALIIIAFFLNLTEIIATAVIATKAVKGEKKRLFAFGAIADYFIERKNGSSLLKGGISLLLMIGIIMAMWWLLKLLFSPWFSTIKQAGTITEEKIATLYLRSLSTIMEESDHPLAHYAKECLYALAESANIDTTTLHFHIYKANVMNAFALPDSHIIVLSGLLDKVKEGELTKEALCGVLAHELSHIVHNHPRKKFIKEIGITLIASQASDASIYQLLNSAISRGFDRTMEKEADTTAVRLLLQANMDPMGLYYFMIKIASDSSIQHHSKIASWLSTHPHPQERAVYLLEYITQLKKTR